MGKFCYGSMKEDCVMQKAKFEIGQEVILLPRNTKHIIYGRMNHYNFVYFLVLIENCSWGLLTNNRLEGWFDRKDFKDLELSQIIYNHMGDSFVWYRDSEFGDLVK